jgi:PAS domain S-box-containing protein
MKTSLLKTPAYPGSALLALIVAIGIWAVFAYAEKERERDMQQWQVHLGLVADSRHDAVDKWLDGQFGSLRELAENGSLRLYLMQLASREHPGENDIEPAQLSYIRNLILAAAERGGFTEKAKEDAIRANLPGQGDVGLLLLDQEGRLLVATHGARLDRELQSAVAKVLKSREPALQGIYPGASGQPLTAFLAPVFPMQASRRDAAPVAVLVGVKRAADELYPLLTRQIRTTQTGETMLVQQEGNTAVYLSPLADGSAPLKKRLSLDTPRLEAAYALKNPGAFGQVRDYRGVDVLVTSRVLTQAPWILVQKVDAQEALQESNAHQRFLMTTFLLAIFFVAAILVAAWRHGSSVRERRAAEALRLKSQELEAQSELLHSITDHITDFIYIVDQDQRFAYANRTLAQAWSLTPQDFVGKTLSSVLGPNVAQTIWGMADEAMTAHEPRIATGSLELERGASRIYHSEAIPLSAGVHPARRALIVSHDITTLQQDQARREQLMRRIVTTLMRAVDLHDPFTANHSSKTTQVALAIGRGMNLDKGDMESLEMAANLANVGKLFVPKEILTKTEPLTEEEQQALRKHVQYSVEILSGLEFPGSVLETIAQKQEHIDGSGYPNGLPGDRILLTAKILAVANAFVAMVNARAYRTGMAEEEALDRLLSETKSRYDRQVVAALFHVAETHPEWIG